MNKTVQCQPSGIFSHKKDLEIDLYKVEYRKSKKPRASFDTSLPFITPHSQNLNKVRINSIRKGMGDTQEQITLMRARINALKQIKSKLSLKERRSLQKIQLDRTVRQRNNASFAHRLQQKEKHNRQLQELRQNAKRMRQGMRSQISNARSTIYMKNMQMAQYKKRLQSDLCSQMLVRRQRQDEQRLNRIQQIKEFSINHAYKLRQFQQSRVKQAEQNYLSRVQRQLQQKEKKQKSLQKLKSQQKKWVDQLRELQSQSQQTLLRANPELQFHGKTSSFPSSGLKNKIN